MTEHPFEVGEYVELSVETLAGPVNFYAKVLEIRGKFIHLELLVYGEAGEVVDVGVRPLLRIMRQFRVDLWEWGFRELRLSANRIAGANPGRFLNETIPLEGPEGD
ncbi:MAG: hypothetical protein RLY93_14580 [Sumerlaeia bacterium]